MHAADPEVTETIKRTDQPYFVLQGNICALLAVKDHVNVFLYDPLVPDPEGIITGGHENKTGRTVAIYQGIRSMRGRSWPCSGPSLPITGLEAGVRLHVGRDDVDGADPCAASLFRYADGSVYLRNHWIDRWMDAPPSRHLCKSTTIWQYVNSPCRPTGASPNCATLANGFVFRNHPSCAPASGERW